MKPYPLMMNLKKRPVLVVGGGRVAVRKVRSLLDAEAAVTVIAPACDPDLEALAENGEIVLMKRRFDVAAFEEIDRPTLVFGTTDDRDVNVEVYRAAEELNIPCNIADVPDLCTFIVPAVVNRGDLTIAVSTGGASPALARRIREDLETRFGPEYAAMTRLMRDVRADILAAGGSSDDNRSVFMKLVDSGLLEALANRDREAVIERLRELTPERTPVEERAAAAMESLE